MTQARVDLAGMAHWTPGQKPAAPLRHFQQIHEGRYRWSILPPGISFTLDRLRRERHELVGELNVQCDIPGARVTPSGSLSTADFNLSSARARKERAALLAERAKSADTIDWQMYLEEFIEQVFDAERTGTPDVELSDVALPTVDETYTVDGVVLLKQHPAILFGDGGACKSYLALYLAAKLATRGVKVLYADWELDAGQHRQRLERLFGLPLPVMRYIRCDRALVHEADRLRRIVSERPIEYLVCDSIAFACDGPPEAAEIAAGYFRALRQIGVGSLHVAHVTKALDSNDQKPFGSVFFHNGARATYFAQVADTDGNDLSVGLYPRKANLNERPRPLGFQIRFGPQRTWITGMEIQSHPELAKKTSVFQRLTHAVRRAPQLRSLLADELDIKEDTLRKIVERHPERFTSLRGVDGGWRVGLVAREES